MIVVVSLITPNLCSEGCLVSLIVMILNENSFFDFWSLFQSNTATQPFSQSDSLCCLSLLYLIFLFACFIHILFFFLLIELKWINLLVWQHWEVCLFFFFSPSATSDYIFRRSGPVHDHLDNSCRQCCRAFRDRGYHPHSRYHCGCSGCHKRSDHWSQKGKSSTYHFA